MMRSAWVGLLVLVPLVIGAVLPMPAYAVVSACEARNRTQGGPTGADLQAVIDAANAGDVVAVRGRCVGNFVVSQDAILVGEATASQATPVLDADRSGEVLRVDSGVTVSVTNFTITGGDTNDAGSGIDSAGALTLVDTIVRHNRTPALHAAVYNTGTMSMDGASSVRRNRGGGILNEGTLALNDTASVTRNPGNFGIKNFGALTMNDSSSVRRHPFDGGIENWDTLTMNGSSSVRGNDGSLGGISNVRGDVVLNASSWISGNTGGGIGNLFGTVTMNGSSSLRGNRAWQGGGMYNSGTLTMNDASSVTGNVARRTGGGVYLNGGTLILNATAVITGNASGRGGGGVTDKNGSVMMNDSSQIADNTALTNGGGVAIRTFGSMTVSASATVTNNRADFDDDGGGTGGGVYCRKGTLAGAGADGKVNDNFRGQEGSRENNIIRVEC